MTVFVGDILNATPATVIANPASTRTWRWLRNGVAIPGFTGTSYRVTGLDTGAPIAVQQIETNLMGSSSAVSVNTANVGAWTPSTIFSASEPGVWYDTDDYTTMFQDSAGTTPVTGAGQPVGLLLDKSKGLALGPELVTNGDFSSGSTGWTAGANIAIVGGIATYTGFDVLSTTATSTISNEKTYIIEFDQGGSGTANILLRFGQNTTNNNSFSSTNGRKRLLFVASGIVDQIIRFRYNGSGTITLDNITIKELPGFHATSTGDSRPRTVIRPLNAERRNLFTRSQEFDAVDWTKNNVTVTANAGVAPDGTNTAERLTATANAGALLQTNVQTIQVYTQSVWVRAESGTVSGAILGISSAATRTDFIATTTWQRVVNTITSLGGSRFPQIRLDTSGTSILIWGAQVEVGSVATDYQRVVTIDEWYDPAVPSYRGIQFDGVDDFLVTPTITPGTDKAQIFAGVRKLSDAAAGVLVEHSANSETSNGSLGAFAPGSATLFLTTSRGTNFTAASTTNTGYAAPVTSVLAGFGDISGDRNTLRINGSQVAQTTTEQGAGNYLAYPLYIGRRAGTSFPFNGLLTSLVVRFGPNLSTSNINRAEYYVSEKTGVTLT